MRRSFFVPGDPQGKQRPRFDTRTKRTYTPTATIDAENLITDYFRVAPGPWPVSDTERFAMTMLFYRDNKRPRDIDNMTKLVMDALNRVAYGDDRQVRRITAEVFYPGEYNGPVGTHITIWSLADDL